MYVVTNGKTYISAKHISEPTMVLEEATTWDEYEKAERVLSDLPRSMQNAGYRVERKKKQSKTDSCSEEVSKMQEFVSITKAFVDLLQEVEQEKCEYRNLLCKYDMMQSDILHRVEMGNCSPIEAYRLYEQLHDLRKQRRDVKHILSICESLESREITYTKLNPILEKLKEQDDEVYKPKILVDLFT